MPLDYEPENDSNQRKANELGATFGTDNAQSNPRNRSGGVVEPPSSFTRETWGSKQYRTSVGKRVTARSPVLQPSPSLSLRSQMSNLRLDSSVLEEDETFQSRSRSENSLFNQVLDWLQHEQAKRTGQRMTESIYSTGSTAGSSTDFKTNSPVLSHRRSSVRSEKGVALDQLEKILNQYMSAKELSASTAQLSKRVSSRQSKRGLRSGSGSESDYFESDFMVPSVDAVLDNSKTLSFTAKVPSQEDDAAMQARRSKDVKHWIAFKSEILRLAHTLKLKGWRRVPMELSSEIDVSRLSGALTNAVYVVSPPKNLPHRPHNAGETPSLVPRRPPAKLLLRIYGPQVSHLIDRENELQILSRLSRKNIGPRLLGTFLNGRFEEYYYAHPLTPKELRLPEISRQIAKRMRELHDGVELLEEERDAGPFVFLNWDKWVERCEKVVCWLDKEILSENNDALDTQTEPWRRRGFVCGVRWQIFRRTVERYREWLIEQSGGPQELRRQLVFAHNDTQYGNLLRLEPREESPLLLPANEHKRLVVIDFEYASANTPGLEFANHFTEWCYNYHDPEKPWACNTKAYPNPDEQRRFITTYICHQSQVINGQHYYTPSPLATPDINPSMISTPRLAPFSLDAPALPIGAWPTGGPFDPDRVRDDMLDTEVQNTMRHARLWRVANSAQWVAWGIVQAKIPAMEKELATGESPASIDKDIVRATESTKQEEQESESETATEMETETETPTEILAAQEQQEQVEEFDYLAYAHDRVLFFWADLLSLGVIQESDLPEQILDMAKSRIINY